LEIQAGHVKVQIMLSVPGVVIMYKSILILQALRQSQFPGSKSGHQLVPTVGAGTFTVMPVMMALTNIPRPIMQL
jgi:hypothetical protein